MAKLADKSNANMRKRHLSTEFVEDLKTGNLKGLLSLLKEDASLALCFRGGLKPEYINVYYKGHSLFKVAKTNTHKITFDFNHGRYTKDWKEKLSALLAIGYKLNNGSVEKFKKPCISKGKVKSPKNELSFSIPNEWEPKMFWQDSSCLLKGLINDFFDITLTEDYFKKVSGIKASITRKNPLIEKQHQQCLMTSNFDINGEYFIFDMEYDQARNSSTEKKSGRFDMLALRDLGGAKYNLVFMELKSTKCACTGKSGVLKHYTDLSKYIANREFIETRKSDAIQICSDYCKLFINKTPSITIKDVELLFIFSGEATRFSGLIPNPSQRLAIAPSKLKYPSV